jgi:flagellar motor switch protein FliM
MRTVMDEVRFQEEIGLLLNAINTETEDDKLNFRPVRDYSKIKIYEFEHPDRFSKKVLQTMSMLHETFARHGAFVLASRFKIPCHIYVASVDQVTYEDFMGSILAPTALAVIDLNGPMMNQAVMEINSDVFFVLIDRAFGGNKGYIKQQRELTRLEWIVMTDVINRLLGSMREGWAQIADLRPKINHTYTNPSYINIAPAEAMVSITLEAKIGDVEGMINIAYPYRCLNGVMPKLTAAVLPGSKNLPLKNYQLTPHDIPVELVAEVFRRDYPVKDILKWKNEEILLPLRPRAPNTCYLRIGAQRIWYCDVLEDKGWFLKKIKINRLAEFPAGSEGRMEIMSGASPAVAEALGQVGITISVELGRTSKSIKETLSLDTGSIFELDKLAGEPMDIRANGVLIAKGEAVVIDGSFGVRITETTNPAGPISSGAGNE